MTSTSKPWVSIIGAGPAALYAAKKLADAGIAVIILNRDIKPGGLVEYGIFPTKHQMKEGLRKQFRKILTHPLVTYYGNVRVADDGDIKLSEIEALKPGAILIAAGAQGRKSLGLPGEDAIGVIHAKELVYHYNRLPPFSSQDFPIGKNVGIIGLGNVMADISNYCCNLVKVDSVLAIGRRGPAERKYTTPEFHHFADHFDRSGFRKEIDRIKPSLLSVGQDPEQLFQEIAKEAPENSPVGKTKFNFHFLSSPKEILKDAAGRIRALRAEKNTLYTKDGQVREKGTGELEEIPMDTLVFAIGDLVDSQLGLPSDRGIFITNPTADAGNPDHHRYQAFDPKTQKVLPGKFLIGWSRKASEGLVGKTRQDAEKGVEALMKYLGTNPNSGDPSSALTALKGLLSRGKNPPIPYSSIVALEKVEGEEAKKRGLEEFKFSKNEDMLKAIPKS